MQDFLGYEPKIVSEKGLLPAEGAREIELRGVLCLYHAMLEATKDKTVIFISHRLPTTRLADYIIMLEKGRIAEQGTHEGLLKKNGKYAQMWRVQAGAYIDV